MRYDRIDCFWNMICSLDKHRREIPDDEIQNKRGVYFFRDWNNEIIRIGRAAKLRNRICSYYSQSNNWYVFEKMQEGNIQDVGVIYTEDNASLEEYYIKKYKPKYNTHNIK